MTGPEAIDFARSSIYVLLEVITPVMLTALVVGLVIGLLQAITQIQEATLTFVPKIIAVMAMSALTASFIGAQIFTFTQEVYAHIQRGF